MDVQRPKLAVESVDDLVQAQRERHTSIGVVAPKEITKVEIVERSSDEEKTFEQKFSEVKKIHDAKRAQLDMFEQTIPPEMKKLDFLKSRVQVSWVYKSPTCSGHLSPDHHQLPKNGTNPVSHPMRSARAVLCRPQR